ncbi:MAG TPA: hypothetical protein VK191_11760 [Symbiobacteriaceae bacterium]|nr:hypothetical protein [Symbiobacteriaceae bacterium]
MGNLVQGDASPAAVMAVEELALVDPQSALVQAEELVGAPGVDVANQARLYLVMAHVSVNILRRTSVEAVFWGHEAVRLASAMPDLDGCRLLFDARVALGRAAIQIGDWARASDALQDALDMELPWLGREAVEWEVMMDLARAQYGRGEYMNALSIVDGAATFLPLICPGRVQLGLWRARCLLKVRDADEAAESLERFRGSEWRLPPRIQAELGALIAMLASLRGDHALAAPEAEAAFRLAKRLEDRSTQAQARLVLALSAAEARQFHRATELANSAMRLGFTAGSVLLMQELAFLMGHLYPQAPLVLPVFD